MWLEASQLIELQCVREPSFPEMAKGESLRRIDRKRGTSKAAPSAVPRVRSGEAGLSTSSVRSMSGPSSPRTRGGGEEGRASISTQKHDVNIAVAFHHLPPGKVPSSCQHLLVNASASAVFGYSQPLPTLRTCRERALAATIDQCRDVFLIYARTATNRMSLELITMSGRLTSKLPQLTE